jgi:hypothetical protein
MDNMITYHAPKADNAKKTNHCVETENPNKELCILPPFAFANKFGVFSATCRYRGRIAKTTSGHGIHTLCGECSYTQAGSKKKDETVNFLFNASVKKNVCHCSSIFDFTKVVDAESKCV